jgi:hypothetical protein
MTWLISRGYNCEQGSKVGWIDAYGYKHFKLKNKNYKCHRVAWLLHYGEWPKGQIDHINGIRTDNRIENLRDVTQVQNSYNKAPHKNSSSKYRGVGWDKKKKKWRAMIRKDGRFHHIGYFDCEKEAALDYNYVSEKMFGVYSRFNKVFDDIRPDEKPT